jgi:hypothetical protein
MSHIRVCLEVMDAALVVDIDPATGQFTYCAGEHML